jgi:hypothetical protein
MDEGSPVPSTVHGIISAGRKAKKREGGRAGATNGVKRFLLSGARGGDIGVGHPCLYHARIRKAQL